MTKKKMRIRVVDQEGELYVNVNDVIKKLIATRDVNKKSSKEIRAKTFNDVADWLHGMLEAYGQDQFEEFKRYSEDANSHKNDPQ